LGKLDQAGTALGDARDLTLLRDALGNSQDNGVFTPADRLTYQKLLTHIENGAKHSADGH
jgi:hypothetical protein